MGVLKFIEKIFYVKPFIHQVNLVTSKKSSLYYITSSDNKELEIFIVINNKMLEINKKIGEDTEFKVFDISVEGLKDWTDRKRKILLMKKSAEISHSKELIEKLTYQINIQKRYVELDSKNTREIFRRIIHFEKDYYNQNIIEINANMSLGRQNHWLD